MSHDPSEIIAARETFLNICNVENSYAKFLWNFFFQDSKLKKLYLKFLTLLSLLVNSMHPCCINFLKKRIVLTLTVLYVERISVLRSNHKYYFEFYT